MVVYKRTMKVMDMALPAWNSLVLALGWLSVALFLIGLAYFIRHQFRGVDIVARVEYIDPMRRLIGQDYLLFGENGPFFVFNLLLIFLIVITPIMTILELIAEKTYRAAAKHSGSHYAYAMSLLYKSGVYRFRSDYFGWGEREAKDMAWLKFPLGLLVIIQDLFPPLARKNYVLKAYSRLIKIPRYMKEFDTLIEAGLTLDKVEIDDKDYHKSQYYGALIREAIDHKNFLVATPNRFKKCIESKVELSEYQLGMFLIQYSDRLPGDGLNNRSEGVELLKIALTKTPIDRPDINNKCCIVIADTLSKSDDASDIASALSILDQINHEDTETIKVEKNEIFVKNSQAARSKEREDFAPEAYRLFRENVFSQNKIPKDKRMIHADYISIKQLTNTLALKLDAARKRDLYLAAEEEKRKATENLMAMFAHKFRGPVDSIIFNTQHKHDERIYLDAARTMTGLLEVFSIVSTASETLVEAMKSDVGGAGSPEKAILRSLKLALMQLLSPRNIKRMSRHYWQHALRHKLMPDSTSFKDWSTQPLLATLEKEIQEKLEMEASALSIENGLEAVVAWMSANMMRTEIHVSDTRHIRFAEYGRKEALLITLMTELFVNAIKHTDATSPQPLSITWDEQEGAVVFTCTNPSNRESRGGLSRGSGRGHSFLKLLLEKMHGQFRADVYQALSSVEVEIPYDLLIGETR